MPDTQSTREASLRVVPANQVAFDDVQSVFGDRGPAARCQCQRYRLWPGESFGKQPVEHARSQRARVLEGYPIMRTDVINEELHVGTVSMFEEAGFRQVSVPTPRRLVMRIDF